MVFRLLENSFSSQESESRHLYSCLFPGKILPRFLSSHSRQREITHPSQAVFFRKSLSPPLRTWPIGSLPPPREPGQLDLPHKLKCSNNYGWGFSLTISFDINKRQKLSGGSDQKRRVVTFKFKDGVRVFLDIINNKITESALH